MGPELEHVGNAYVGALIVNADDWGRDHETTDRTLDCFSCGVVSSVSAMVFMQDSERAAAIARERGIDAGLHLNFTTRFSGQGIPARLAPHQERVAQSLRRNRLSQVAFHPGLTRDFEYLVAAQRDEFTRLYGREPVRLDGHHHMHLCANVLLGGLMPRGTVVRRNFSFQQGEKGFCNRFYRQVVDRALARRHRLAESFFALSPLTPVSRLQRIFRLACHSVVELETHPPDQAEYRFLTEGGLFSLVGDCPIATRFAVSPDENA